MISFSVAFKSGIPVYEQVVFAVKKAIVSGQLKEGDKFPSVREMSQAFKINPNTAQKVVSQLVRDLLLEVRPGIGTVVAAPSASTEKQKQVILDTEVERLVVEAKRLLIKQGELIEAIRRYWDLTR